MNNIADELNDAVERGELSEVEADAIWAERCEPSHNNYPEDEEIKP